MRRIPPNPGDERQTGSLDFGGLDSRHASVVRARHAPTQAVRTAVCVLQVDMMKPIVVTKSSKRTSAPPLAQRGSGLSMCASAGIRSASCTVTGQLQCTVHQRCAGHGCRYSEPPTGELCLREFEDAARDRLHGPILIAMPEFATREISMGYVPWRFAGLWRMQS